MNEEQYLTFNIYDEAEVNDTLRFAPTLGWKLFSLQDIYSRSDAYHVTNYGEKDSAGAAKKSWSGNFADAVNDNDFSSLDFSGEGIETHITSYSKLVLTRSSSLSASTSKIEDVWELFMTLLTKIGKRADNIDGIRASATSSKKSKGTGSFVWGLLLMILGGLTAGGGAYLKMAGTSSNVTTSAVSSTSSGIDVSALILRAASSSAESSSAASSVTSSASSGSVGASILSKIVPFANYVLYAGIGVAALGILLFIVGLVAINKGNKLSRQCHHGINECIKDYRDVKKAKKAFEDLVSQGQQTSVNLRWLYSLCLKYGVAFPSSLTNK
jgi:hypothetical protein